MPRPANPSNERHQQEQRRYRQRLRDQCVPEASAVDAALSKALAAYARVVRDEKRDPSALRAVLNAAAKLLENSGYDNRAAVARVKRRVGRRGAGEIAITAGLRARS